MLCPVLQVKRFSGGAMAATIEATAIARPKSEAQVDEMVLVLIRYYRVIGKTEKALALGMAVEVTRGLDL